jgi:hypothetical protein
MGLESRKCLHYYIIFMKPFERIIRLIEIHAAGTTVENTAYNTEKYA